MKLRALALLLASLLFAGCAAPSDEGVDDGGSPTVGGDVGADPSTPTTGGAGAGVDDGGASDGGATEEETAFWAAFAFDEPVTTKTGQTGLIRSYAYTNTIEEDGKETVVDVDVVVEGVSTEDIRVQTLDMSSATPEMRVVSTPLEVTKLRHELTVVKDDTGERVAGETTTVTVYVPVGELPESTMFVWFFSKMTWENADGEAGTWEYHLSEEMQAEQESGEGTYLPYTEGDSSSWWGFELMTSTYGLSWFAPYVRGEQAFEEGSFSYGGYSQEVQRETFTVGGHSFAGWSVEMSGSSAGASSGWMMKAADDLPMPVAFRFGSSQDGGDSSIVAYELTDLEIA